MPNVADTDYSIATNGNIRRTGTATTQNTVLEFHQWLANKMDDAQAVGDDILDITSDTADDRKTDQILTLNSPFNIDDTVARFLYDGSITQKGGDEVYSGALFLGTVVSGTQIILIQNNKVLPAYWGTGLNPDAANNIFMRIMVKTRTGGADIDGKRITARSNELSDQFKEFKATLGLANSTFALTSEDDINNTKSDATLEGFTDIVNVEGFQEINIDGSGAAGQEFYSQWDKGSRTTNDVYEKAKQIQQRAHVADSGADTGTNYVVDNATILGQGQEFTSRAVIEKLEEMRFRLKVGGGTPVGTVYAELYDSDDAATAAPLPALAAAIADDGGVFTNQTTAANNATTNDMTLLPVTPVVNDAYYFAASVHTLPPWLDLQIGTAGAGTWTIAWEYHVGGSVWRPLPKVVDGTTGFTAAAGWRRVSWNRPSDSVATTINAQGPFHYVRARVSAFTSITTQPLGTKAHLALAQSESVLVSSLTSAYAEVIFRFEDNFSMNATQEYFCVVRNDDGDATNFVHVDGATAGADNGNRAEETPAGTWTGATNDLWFSVKTSPVQHARAGEKFRGIEYEIIYDTEAGGPFTEDEVIFWGTAITYDGLTAGPFQVGEFVKFGAVATPTVAKNGGKILKDTGTVLTVALENATIANLLDNDRITGLSSGATADINITITDQNKAGGEGLLLALDDNGTTGDFYIQLLSGQSPVDNLPIEGRDSQATALVNVTVTARSTKPEFVGVSTGTNIIGAYGIGYQAADVGPSDKFTSLDNTARTPQNKPIFTVSGLVSGEDRILVGPRSGTTLQKNQRTLNTTLSGAAELAVVVTAAIPTSGTPASGAGADNTRLRVQLDTGIYRRQEYSSFTASTFTIPSTDYTGANVATAPRDVFIAYIDVLADATTEAYQAVHTTDQDVIIRVRDGGTTPIKTVEISDTFGSSSKTVSITRQTDA